ncbi:major tail protein [Streptomyces phage Shaeky]|uniref:Major tail protein n=1 Tax=Streptomyces phage Shaeky TaxID=2767586 RepID=A0A873WE03_9CAUD|nr:major tail protein [Streptomyces phage Shaeky]
MAQNDTEVILPGTGYVYLATPNTAKPAGSFDPLAPGVGWDSIGHTSLENGIEFGRDGDDPETRGSWQNPKLRTTNPDVTYTIALNALQASVETYKLYFGASDGAVQADGSFKIPAKPTAQSKALLLVLVDGEQMLPVYFPNVSLLGSDAITFDPTALLEFPISGTILAGADGSLGDIDAFVAPGTPAA